MSETNIFYFTGSGNSLAVAKDLAAGLDATLSPIAPHMRMGSISVPSRAMGLVFPIYDFKPPAIVNEFIRKINDLNSKYLFAVCTYGIAPSLSLAHLAKTVHTLGGTLSAGFAAAMPHNGIGSAFVTEKQAGKLFEAWKTRVPLIQDIIKNRKTTKLQTSIPIISAIRPSSLPMVPSLLSYLALSLIKGAEALSLAITNECDKCGMCARICPAKNIAMVNKTPVWSDNCTGCLACLHWCPMKAVTLARGKLDVKQYHHPNVGIREMVGS